MLRSRAGYGMQVQPRIKFGEAALVTHGQAQQIAVGNLPMAQRGLPLHWVGVEQAVVVGHKDVCSVSVGMDPRFRGDDGGRCAEMGDRWTSHPVLAGVAVCGCAMCMKPLVWMTLHWVFALGALHCPFRRAACGLLQRIHTSHRRHGLGRGHALARGAWPLHLT